MEASFERAPVGNELRSRIVAFGETRTLSARLAERSAAEQRVVIDLDAQTLDLTEVGVDSA